LSVLCEHFMMRNTKYQTGDQVPPLTLRSAHFTRK
jgi:hypothetical protein